MMGENEFHVEQSQFGCRLRLFWRQMTENGFAVAQPVQMVVHEEEGMVQDPCAVMTKDDGQRLMDALWSAGLRPSEGTGSSGSLAATQDHLEDMRALVFKSGKPG